MNTFKLGGLIPHTKNTKSAVCQVHVKISFHNKSSQNYFQSLAHLLAVGHVLAIAIQATLENRKTAVIFLKAKVRSRH